jgi:DNA polymerase-3 subunit delta
VIVKNPNNPYPVYQMLKKSERFTKQELLAALNHLSEADLRLKSTGQNPRMVLEDMIFRIFGKV